MSIFSNLASRAPEEAAAYSAAILDLLGKRDPMTVLRETPAALDRAIAGLSDAQLRRREREGKWSIVHVLQHLADSEVVGAWRFRLIAAQDRPQITGYDQDLWADRLGYENADPKEALEEFRVVRRANLRLFDRATPEDLRRIGVHAERGEESLEHLRRMYAGHDILHLNQIDRIRKAITT